MPRLNEDTTMDSIRIRVPHDELVKVEAMIKDAGLYKSYFWQVAAMMGARALLRLLVPEHFITETMMNGMMSGVLSNIGLAKLSDEEVASFKAALSEQTGVDGSLALPVCSV